MGKKILLKTTMGDVTIELSDGMPVTAGNFLQLVQKGFYDGLIFHRVIPGFMIQGGCPKGDGTGGPGYAIQDEFAPGNHNGAWTVAMANAGPNTGGSQFFINLVDNAFLDRKHPVFGKVVAGREVMEAISMTDVDDRDKPLKEVKILKAAVA
jgi:peptidylprolyl isomerase